MVFFKRDIRKAFRRMNLPTVVGRQLRKRPGGLFINLGRTLGGHRTVSVNKWQGVKCGFVKIGVNAGSEQLIWFQ